MKAPSATSAVRTPLQVLFRIRVVCLGFMNGIRKKNSVQQLGSHFQNTIVPCKFNDISYGKWCWENLMVCWVRI